jgi:hypothetical protein
MNMDLKEYDAITTIIVLTGFTLLGTKASGGLFFNMVMNLGCISAVAEPPVFPIRQIAAT